MTARDRTGEPLQPALDDPEPDPETGEIHTRPDDPQTAAGWLEHMRQTLRAGR